MKTDEQLYQYAERMRQEPTPAELATLGMLTAKKGASGWRFEHQFVFGHFILDFVLPERLLVIELDGSAHTGREDYDFKRDLFCKRCGLRVLRIQNSRAEALLQLAKSYPILDNWQELWTKAVAVAMAARETGDAPTLVREKQIVKPEDVRKKRRETTAPQKRVGPSKQKAKALGKRKKLSNEARQSLAAQETRSPVLARRREEGKPIVPFVNPDKQPAPAPKKKFDIFSRVKKAQGRLG